jgi:anthranilate phosphoribosyltransferase
MVMLNASAAFVAAGLCDNFKEGIKIAADSIDSGKAHDKLDKLIEFTRQCKPFVRNEL